jgi:DNA-binding beta-propeller fold protein YncE
MRKLYLLFFMQVIFVSHIMLNKANCGELNLEYLGSFGRPPSKAPGEFNYPSGIAIDHNTGVVYVTESIFNRVQKFDASGQYLDEWRCNGCLGIDVDQISQDIYVALPGYNLVRKFDQSGQVLFEWGSMGSSEGEFNRPRDVAVHPINGNVYVLDSNNNRVQVFNNSGTFLFSFHGDFVTPYGIDIDQEGIFVYITNTGESDVQKFDSNGNYIETWGSRGADPGQFRWPRGVSVDSIGNVYVADSDGERLQKFDSHGNFLKIIVGPHNWTEGPFHPRAVEVNLSSNEVFVAAAYAHRIDVFDPEGIYLRSWGHHESYGQVFNQPKGIAVDPTTNQVYVADSLNHIIKRFSKYGDFEWQFGGFPNIEPSTNYLAYPAPLAIDSNGNIWGVNEGIYYPEDLSWGSDKFVRQFDRDGNYLNGFTHSSFTDNMYGFALNDNDGEIFIATIPKWVDENKIIKFDLNGNHLLEFGSFGSGPGEFIRPAGISIDPNDQNLAVIDSGNQRVLKFDRDGHFLYSWGNSGDGPGEFKFNQYSGVANDAFGNVYVSDSGNNRVQVFNSAGEYLANLGSYGWGVGKFAWPADLTIADGILYVLDTGGSEVEMYNIATRYEDAEDGLVSGWWVYDSSPEEAEVKNVFDSDRQSRVIQFIGSGTDNGYSIGNGSQRWLNTEQKVIEWSMKYSEPFVVYVNVDTSAGLRHLYYTPEDRSLLGDEDYVHHGIGSSMADGTWHRFFRDLQADLQEAQPDVIIYAVNRFLVRGNGFVDDLKLHYEIPFSIDTDVDSISDKDELTIYGTNPNLIDTDTDGIADGDELAYWGTESWDLDFDEDGIPALLDSDADGDNILDGVELQNGTDPSIPDISSVLYEDAEDGLIFGWWVYDSSPAGAEIINTFDLDRQSRVIQFIGSGTDNGYSIGNGSQRWINTEHRVIEWSMKYSEPFIVYVKVDTSAGIRHIYYTPEDRSLLGNNDYVHHGLGSSMTDGVWHTFYRDLQADLEEAQPGVTINTVNRFLIRGSGFVDDILLR